MANDKQNTSPNVPNKGNVPRLRFPEFTEEWNFKTLDTLAPNISAGKDYANEGNYKLYGSTGVIGTTDKPSYKGEILLVARVGANAGYLQYVNGEFGVTDNTLVVNAHDNNRYIYYYLQHYNLNRLVFGSGQPLITGGMLKKVPIGISNDCAEKNKIVKLLSLLDARIATQNKIIEQLQSLIKGICNKLLYAENGKQVRLADMLTERTERTRENNQHEVLSSTIKGIFSQREYFSKDIASENNIGYKVIRLYDIVLSPQNLWMGNINYNEKYEIGIVSPSYKIFSIKPKYDKKFVAAMLKTHRALYNYMLVSEQGASIVRRNLNMEAFEQLVFKMPPYNKQREIGKTLSVLQTRLELESKIKLDYEQLKKHLLTEMFI